jgi:hypothetical protein
MRPRLLSLLLCLPLLAGCENEGTAYLIQGKDESISLLREQRWFWSDKVYQSIVVSRMPDCLRRYEIRTGSTASVKVEVFEYGDRVWALRQGRNWYLAGTQSCQFQRWEDPPLEPPGPQVGTFTRKDGKLVFVSPKEREAP